MKKILILVISLLSFTSLADVVSYNGGYLDVQFKQSCRSRYFGDQITKLTQIQSEKVFIKLYSGLDGHSKVGYYTKIFFTTPDSIVTTKSTVHDYDCPAIAKCVEELSSSEISVSASCTKEEENLIVHFIPNN